MNHMRGQCSSFKSCFVALGVLVCAVTMAALLAGASCGPALPPPDTDPIPGGGTWRSFASAPESLHESAVAVIGDSLYTVGGRVPGGPISKLYRYDPPPVDGWTQLASYPGTPVDHMGAVAVNGILYAFGGTTEFPGPSVAHTFAYDPASDSWTVRASMPRTLGVMGVGVVDDKIYCIGGLSNFQTSNTVFEYDPAQDVWTDLTAICPMPTPRDHFVAATVNGKIHCIGGRQTTIESILSVHEVFDPATRTWQTMAAMPTARGGFSAAVLDGRILIMGGEGAANAFGVFSENEEYNPATNTWRTLSPMITPRHSAQAGVIGDVVYVPAGGTRIGRTFTSVNEGFSFAFE